MIMTTGATGVFCQTGRCVNLCAECRSVQPGCTRVVIHLADGLMDERWYFLQMGSFPFNYTDYTKDEADPHAENETLEHGIPSALIITTADGTHWSVS